MNAKKRFVVLLGKATEEQQNAFLEYVKRQQLGWWHWLEHSWLLVGTADSPVTAKQLRTDMELIFPNVHMLVLQPQGDIDWSGYGPNTPDQNMFNWLHKDWH